MCIRDRDKGIPVDVIYLDFQKNAFDKVPHKRLMEKVRVLGISGKIANWLEEWRRNRKQRVVVTWIFFLIGERCLVEFRRAPFWDQFYFLYIYK